MLHDTIVYWTYRPEVWKFAPMVALEYIIAFSAKGVTQADKMK